MWETDFLTCLPAHVSVIIVTDYLQLKDIGKLDAAYSQKELRGRFLSLYQEEACVLKIQHHSVITFTPSFCNWVMSRSVAVGGITLHKSWNTTHTNTLISYLKDCGSHLWFFNTALDRSDTMSVAQYKSIVKQCPELKILSGVPISFVTKHAMEVTRASCPALTSVKIIDNDDSVTSGSVNALRSLVGEGGLPLLQTLRIPMARNLGQVLEVVAVQCPKLERLIVSPSEHHTMDDGNAVLSALSTNSVYLTELVLPAHHVTDDHFIGLSNNVQLTTLSLTDCSQLTSRAFEAVSLECRRITELALKDVEVNEEDPQPILHTSQFYNLQRLLLERCTSVFDADLLNISTTCPKLVEARLYLCFNVSDVGVCSLSARCPLLTKLCVSWAQITDDTFAQLAQTSTQLTHLEIRPFESFQERKGVKAAFAALTQLQSLIVRNSHLLDDQGVLATLLQNCSQLRSLDTLNCELCEDAMQILESTEPPFQYLGEGLFER